MKLCVLVIILTFDAVAEGGTTIGTQHSPIPERIPRRIEELREAMG
jgi:hypothetical protein